MCHKNITGLEFYMHGNTYERGYRELHRPDRKSIGFLLVRILGDELIQSKHVHCIPTRQARPWLPLVSFPSIYVSSLDALHVQVFLLPGNVVWSHDSNSASCWSLPGKDLSESEESALVRSWNHLRYIRHKRAVLITVSDCICIHIIEWTFVHVLRTILLCLGRRRKVEDIISKRASLAGSQACMNLFVKALPVSCLSSAIMVTPSFCSMSPTTSLSDPSCKDRWFARLVHSKVGQRLQVGESVFFNSSTPNLAAYFLAKPSHAMQSSRENSPVLRMDLNITKKGVFVGSHDHICSHNDTSKCLIRFLTFNLELQETSVISHYSSSSVRQMQFT